MIVTNDLETKLNNSLLNFNSNGGYNQDSLPEVYAYYKEYIATGQYPYIRTVAEYIHQKEAIKPELLKHLETQVYLASKQYKQERDIKYKEDMINNGWNVLTPEIIKREYEAHNKIEISAVTQGAIFSGKLEGIFKPFIDNNGTCYIMKPRATRKGYLLQNLENPFYKVIMKGE